MKRVVVPILLISILINSLGHTLLFANYLLNKNFYATVLCENKEKPQLHCEGKCHLKKELKQQEEQEKNPISSIKVKIETIQLFQQLSHFSIITNNESKVCPILTSIGKISSPAFFIFHPPRA